MRSQKSSNFIPVFIPFLLFGAAAVGAFFIRSIPYRLIYACASAAFILAGGTVYFYVLSNRRSGRSEIAVTEEPKTERPPATAEAAGAKQEITPNVIREIDTFFESISEDIRGKSDVIPVFIKQLQSVIEMTEEAAMTLSSSFMGINKKAKSQVSEVASIFGEIHETSGETASTDSLLTHLKEVLETLVSELKGITDFVKRNQKSINQILTDIGQIKEIVSKIDNITEDSKVLSINAAIEAARAGENGKGFAVVASEFRKLSEDSEQAHREIQEIIEHVTDNTELILEFTEENVKRGDQAANRAENILQGTVDEIDKTIGNIRNNLGQLSDHAQDLAKNISNIVVSIQFQDITRQRIEHVIEPLNEYADDLSQIAERLKNADTEDFILRKSHADRLKESYTMEQEKEILRSTVSSKEE